MSSISDIEKNLSNMEKFIKKSVYVGVPATKGTRRPSFLEIKYGIEPENNAEIAFINEYGDEAKNIPERSFIREGIKRNRDTIDKYMGLAAIAASNGNQKEYDININKVGLSTQASIQKVFSSNNWPRNRLITLKMRAYENEQEAISKKSNKIRPTSIAPLLVTRQLLRAISYVIRSIDG